LARFGSRVVDGQRELFAAAAVFEAARFAVEVDRFAAALAVRLVVVVARRSIR
jgi:hypothetical protein